MPLTDELSNRDWSIFEHDAASHWNALRNERGPQATFEVGAALHRHARTVRPDWPRDDERERDLAHHRELIAILGRVPASGR